MYILRVDVVASNTIELGGAPTVNLPLIYPVVPPITGAKTVVPSIKTPL